MIRDNVWMTSNNGFCSAIFLRKNILQVVLHDSEDWLLDNIKIISCIGRHNLQGFLSKNVMQ